MKSVKFTTQVNEKILKEVRAYARSTGLQISKIVTEALREYLQKQKVSPTFGNAMDEVLRENADLLSHLAK